MNWTSNFQTPSSQFIFSYPYTTSGYDIKFWFYVYFHLILSPLYTNDPLFNYVEYIEIICLCNQT